jgi:hypothetical protein
LRGGEQQGRGGERLPRMAWRGELVHGNSWGGQVEDARPR